jgi:tRNA U34 2-thiouridine synthase MnmA/TrmU
MKKIIFIIIICLFAVTGSQAGQLLKPPKHNKLMKRMTRAEVRQVASGRNLYSYKKGKVEKNRICFLSSGKESKCLPYYKRKKQFPGK